MAYVARHKGVHYGSLSSPNGICIVAKGMLSAEVIPPAKVDPSGCHDVPHVPISVWEQIAAHMSMQ